jgi:S1-C subfamily serine protease
MTRAAVFAAVAAFIAAVGVGRANTATIAPTRGVVLINTNLALQNASAAGTGIVLTKTGEVLTNNHVIAGATTIKVTVPSTKRTYTANVLGYDISDDIALLKLQGASNLATVTRGNSAKLKVGQFSRAVGNAQGGGKLVMTTGRVTAVNQSITVQDDNGEVAQLSGLIETSAKLVPGDSGGPLLDSLGRVIGVDAAGSPTFSFNQSAPGYAIPINRAATLATQIEAKRSSATVHIGATAFIGLTVQETDGGVAIGTIVPSSPAESAGLEQGDVITSLDGSPVNTFDDLRTTLFSKHPGDSITLAYTDTTGASTTTTLVLANGPPQ